MKTDDLIFDEDEAVKFIIDYLPADAKERISEDDIDYVLDVMCEFYEENGLMEESSDEASIDEEAMFNFIFKTIKKDKAISLSEEDLQLILDGEFEYGKSIGIYTEEN